MTLARLRCIAIATAAFSAHCLAADSVLTFNGACQNSLCSSTGADGTTPGTVTARITLSDLAWEPAANGFSAIFTDASSFSYTSPRYTVSASNSGVVPARVQFFSTSASVASIVDFDITFTDGANYFAGDATGFGMGIYFPLMVGGFIVPTPINFDTSTQSGIWSLSAVPEPTTAGLLGAGIAALAWRRRLLSAASTT